MSTAGDPEDETRVVPRGDVTEVGHESTPAADATEVGHPSSPAVQAASPATPAADPTQVGTPAAPVADPTQVGHPSSPATPVADPTQVGTPADPTQVGHPAPAWSTPSTPAFVPTSGPATPYPATQYPAAPYPGGSAPAAQYTAPQYPGQPYPGPLYAGQPAPTQTAWRPPAPPPPPTRPEHTRRWIAGLTAVILVVAGLLGTGTWLLVGSLGPSVPEGYTPVEAGYLTYAVPSDWTPPADDSVRILGVTFRGGADGPAYTCRGDGYRRGLATSTLIRTDDAPAAVATRFANELGRAFYTGTAGHTPTVTLSDARATTVGDAMGAVVEADVRTSVDDGCLATRGTVAILAVPVENGTAVLVANVDTEGGPSSSPLSAPDTVEEIIGSAG